jgi:anti-anti-sigma regulatory factor
MQVSCVQENTSKAIILQPQGLSGALGQSFQQSLDGAMSSTPTIIVDLLWVESIDSEGLHLLAEALLRSQTEGKDLTFLGLERKAQIEIERRTQKGSALENRDTHCIFAPEFEAFLDRHRDAKASEALS